MLIAEIHGNGVPNLHDHEDSLTSAVFGHLRYLPPTLFWEALFSRARGLPDSNGGEASLSQIASSAGAAINAHSMLTAYFWSRHPLWGEPDLLLHFSGGGVRSVVVLIEAKLWSGKSGSGENDQLARYLYILDDLDALSPPLPKITSQALRFLVYLTPRDALAEIEDSLSDAIRISCKPLPHKPTKEFQRAQRQRVFRLRWQDIAAAAESVATATPGVGEPAHTIVQDVARFLHRRGLHYFDGFDVRSGLDGLTAQAGHFYTSSASTSSVAIRTEPTEGFAGFTQIPLPQPFAIRKGAWNRD